MGGRIAIDFGVFCRSDDAGSINDWDFRFIKVDWEADESTRACAYEMSARIVSSDD